MEFGPSLNASSKSPTVTGGQRTPQYSNRLRTRSGGHIPSPGTPILGTGDYSNLSRLGASPGRPSPVSRGRQLHSTEVSLLANPAHRSRSGSTECPLSGRILGLFSALPLATNYNLIEQIGEGTFSTVYMARKEKTLNEKKEVALKHLVPTSKPGRIMTEIKCMKDAAGHPNVIPLLGVWRVGGDVVLAMPYIDHCRFMDLVATADLAEVQLYMANLLAALEHIHTLGIIHRDIKPSNFLYDRNRRKFALVDFGLAQREETMEHEVRGNKRRLTEEGTSGGGQQTKRARVPLAETSASKLNCSPKPVQDILRQHIGGDGVRRSPRKPYSPLTQDLETGEQELISPMVSPTDDTPKQRLNFAFNSNRTAVRCSPRKLNLNMTSIPKIAGDSPLSPSPTLQRHGSFTQLVEPSTLSQTTDNLGCTPLLRASLTSHCSSVLYRRQSSNPSQSSPSYTSCSCPGQLRICDSCQSLPHLHAPRAGTPGFRPPEVLLKYPLQTVSVDMWAVGVILLSFMSRSYPFFRAPDDMMALAELTTIFGSAAISAAAQRYGRMVTFSHPVEPSPLEAVCKELSLRGDNTSHHLVTDQAADFLKRLLNLNLGERISAKEALQHPFVMKGNEKNQSKIC